MALNKLIPVPIVPPDTYIGEFSNPYIPDPEIIKKHQEFIRKMFDMRDKELIRIYNTIGVLKTNGSSEARFVTWLGHETILYTFNAFRDAITIIKEREEFMPDIIPTCEFIVDLKMLTIKF